MNEEVSWFSANNILPAFRALVASLSNAWTTSSDIVVHTFFSSSALSQGHMWSDEFVQRFNACCKNETDDPIWVAILQWWAWVV